MKAFKALLKASCCIAVAFAVILVANIVQLLLCHIGVAENVAKNITFTLMIVIALAIWFYRYED